METPPYPQGAPTLRESRAGPLSLPTPLKRPTAPAEDRDTGLAGVNGPKSAGLGAGGHSAKRKRVTAERPLSASCGYRASDRVPASEEAPRPPERRKSARRAPPGDVEPSGRSEGRETESGRHATRPLAHALGAGTAVAQRR